MDVIGDVTVLLVEDDPFIADLLESALTDESFKVLLRTRGEDALEDVDADATRFQVLVTDIQLGTGLDGWALARRARERLPDLPVVYMSGEKDRDWAAYGVPHSIMIPKPFVPAQLITAIASLLNRAVGD